MNLAPQTTSSSSTGTSASIVLGNLVTAELGNLVTAERAPIVLGNLVETLDLNIPVPISAVYIALRLPFGRSGTC